MANVSEKPGFKRKRFVFFFFQLSFPFVLFNIRPSIRLVGSQSELRAFFQSVIVAFFSKHFQSCNKSLINHACSGRTGIISALGIFLYSLCSVRTVKTSGRYSPGTALALGKIDILYSRIPGAINSHLALTKD